MASQELSWEGALLGESLFLPLCSSPPKAKEVLQVLLLELQINLVNRQVQKYRICD